MRLAILPLALMAMSISPAAAQPAATLLERAQQLAWSKQFEDAAQIYLEVLDKDPSTQEARLGLARVRLWQGRYTEARRLFGELLERNPGDGDAAEGAALASYWSGDFRTAAREFRAVVEAHPERVEARRSLNELQAASASRERLETEIVDDDQPFRGSRSEARHSFFTDPLTRWDIGAGLYTVRSEIGGGHAVPFASIRNETFLPAWRLSLTTFLDAIRTPDDRTHAAGGMVTRLRLPRENSIAFSFTRRPLLSNATRQYPLASAAAVRWDHAKPWLASAGIEFDRFSDDNSATAADVYALFALMRPPRWTIWAGASAMARDTEQSRFSIESLSAVREATGLFRYTYNGAYDPYWTPHDLIDGRLIVAIEREMGAGRTIRLQADYGWARDRAVGFWPETGADPFPTEIGTAMFDRTYAPWRIRFGSSLALTHRLTLEVAYEHSVTVFYRAHTVHVALARRG